MVPWAKCGAAVVAAVGAVVTAIPAGAEPVPPAPGPAAPAPPAPGPAAPAPPAPGPAAPVPPAPAPAAPAPAAPADPAIVPAAVTDPGAPPPPTAAVNAAVVSAAPVRTTTPDGWTMALSAKDETQAPIAPLTTAISTREYEVGGVFNGELTGGDGTPSGVFEVGYQIGCGIDMSTSNGVSMTGTAGVSPSVQFLGIDASTLPVDGILPGIGANFAGGLTVGLKPGFVNTVPVTKKRFESTEPWVAITGFRIKIDGCVGESFIRSYAILTKSDDAGDAILSWYGTTKAV